MRTIFYTLVFIVPILLSAQVYDTSIPLTQAMQGVTQAQFANVGGAGYQDICVSTYLDKRLAWFNGDGEGSFLAELELVGNKNTELIVLQPEDNPSPIKNTQSTWDTINKDELMEWIQKQTEK